jgi:hypothetical protein
VALPVDLVGVLFYITASAASGSLDIDYIIAMAVDNPYARVIQLLPIKSGGAYATGANPSIVIDPQPLAALTPSVTKTIGALTDIFGYLGDAYPLASSTLFQAAIMCKEINNTSFWTYAIASSAETFTVTAARLNAYLAPE